MKSYIQKLLNNVSGDIPNIIHNLVLSAKYNSSLDRFELSLTGFGIHYFDDASKPKSGIIENTPIHWEVEFDKFAFWLE